MSCFDFLRKDIRIYKLKRHFKQQNATIHSRYVSMAAKLSYKNKIDAGAVVTENVSLGRYSFVGVNTFVDMADIGAFVSIGRNCSIGAYEHPYKKTTLAPAVYRTILNRPEAYDDHAERINIGNDVWIGNNACICGGVTIGNGVVIGAGAVVTHDIPDYAIAAGVPARVIKYRFEPGIIRKLSDLSWWEWSDEEIRENKDLFLDGLEES